MYTESRCWAASSTTASRSGSDAHRDALKTRWRTAALLSYMVSVSYLHVRNSVLNKRLAQISVKLRTLAGLGWPCNA